MYIYDTYIKIIDVGVLNFNIIADGGGAAVFLILLVSRVNIKKEAFIFVLCVYSMR